MNKIIDFKTVSPLFEEERDGGKNFTLRKVDYKDSRFRVLDQWKDLYDWYIRITNPANSESFIRLIRNVSYLQYVDCSRYREDESWRLIFWHPYPISPEQL